MKSFQPHAKPHSLPRFVETPCSAIPECKGQAKLVWGKLGDDTKGVLEILGAPEAERTNFNCYGTVGIEDSSVKVSS